MFVNELILLYFRLLEIGHVNRMKEKKEKKEICHKSEDKQNAQCSTAWTILLLLFIVEVIKVIEVCCFIEQQLINSKAQISQPQTYCLLIKSRLCLFL